MPRGSHGVPRDVFLERFYNVIFIVELSFTELLVGGFNPSEKYESVGITFPNIWKNKNCSKPPTSLTI